MKRNRLKDSIELRSMNDADWSNYIEHVVSSDEVYVQYGLEPTEELLEAIQTGTPGVFYYSIYHKMYDIMIGYIGIFPENDNIELHVFRNYRGNGHGSLAAAMLIDAYFSGMITGEKQTRVEAEVLPENNAAIRLLEKLRFQKDAIGLQMSFDKEVVIGKMTAYRSYTLKKEDLENRGKEDLENREYVKKSA